MSKKPRKPKPKKSTPKKKAKAGGVGSRPTWERGSSHLPPPLPVRKPKVKPAPDAVEAPAEEDSAETPVKADDSEE